MYSKFNLEISEYFYNAELNRHLEKGKEIYSEFEAKAKKSLKEFIYDNKHIDGSSMKDNWFNIGKADVFISHSHKDISKVKAFAGWLYEEFKLTAFIDSCAWGYCDNLLKQIDDDYCKKSDGKTYDYDRRNYSTSHVHMMLSTALSEMIDNTECIMFYNTPNSISLVDDLNTIKEEKKKITLSPWIYHELSMTSLIRPRNPIRDIPILEKAIEHRAFSEKNSLDIGYDVDKYLGEMFSISSNNLNSWKKLYSILTHKIDGDSIPYITGYEDIYPLDVLYNVMMTEK